eukprot:s1969_g3.t1
MAHLPRALASALCRLQRPCFYMVSKLLHGAFDQLEHFVQLQPFGRVQNLCCYGASKLLRGMFYQGLKCSAPASALCHVQKLCFHTVLKLVRGTFAQGLKRSAATKPLFLWGFETTAWHLCPGLETLRCGSEPALALGRRQQTIIPAHKGVGGTG